jgi:hypothetical protein
MITVHPRADAASAGGKLRREMEDHDKELGLFVPDAISDDLEDFNIVAFEVSRWAACDGVILERDDVWRGLHRQLCTGEARAFWMNRDWGMAELKEIPDPPAPDACYISS